MSGRIIRQCSALSLAENDYVKSWKGQLRITIKAGSGVLTIHIREARYIQTENNYNVGRTFVQVLIIGKNDSHAYIDVRTKLVDNDGDPEYKEVFSFELIEAIIQRRIEVNVWRASDRGSYPEFLGCMSFGVRSLLGHNADYSQRADGWYYLLDNPIGTRKHLPVPKDLRELRRKSLTALNGGNSRDKYSDRRLAKFVVHSITG